MRFVAQPLEGWRTARRRRRVLAPCATAAIGGAAILLSGVRGADYPAQFLRASLWDDGGPAIWNFYWYTGHSTPAYSVLAPPLAALVGPVLLACLASLVATYCFSSLTDDLLDTPTTTVGNHVFAVGTLVNVAVGRSSFALGFAVALVALLLWHRQRRGAALLAAVAVPLSSPIAATFVGLAGAAHVAVGRCERRPWSRDDAMAIGIAVAANVPLVIIGVLFTSAGEFSFQFNELVISTAICALLALVARGAIRAGALLTMVASGVLFIVPNPMGTTFLRITQFVAVPLAVVCLANVSIRPRRVLATATVAAFGWNAQFGVSATVAALGDESADREYFEPLIDEVAARNDDGRPLGRLDIPFTENHWESYFVAPEVPFARGWERQTDRVRNPELYEHDLGAAGYRRWLLANGVRWVAVPDAGLDNSSKDEADLVSDAAWLDLVWRSGEWQLYEVADYQPIADPPAYVLSQSAEAIELSVTEPATTVLRYEWADELTISGHADACIRPSDDGWVEAEFSAAGRYELGADLESLLPGESPARCDDA